MEIETEKSRSILKTSRPLKGQKTARQEREHQVLIGLIERYIETGKPVGSNTLKDEGFDDLSSATIRNYFVNLEKEGYLHQQHASGGRIPTENAFRLYAHEVVDNALASDSQKIELDCLTKADTREIPNYLQKAVELLSNMANCAVFISAPRFDHDYISQIKMLVLDSSRCLCVIMTDFGALQTEIIYVDTKLSAFSVKRIEEYFHWRLTGHDEPLNMGAEEEGLAQKIYNELIIRYLIAYSTFSDEDIYRTGFSKLLAYPEFHDAAALANSLTLLENKHTIRLLLKETSSTDNIKFWINEDFSHLAQATPSCAALGIPYYINNVPVGAVGIMGPVRMPYKENFGLLKAFSEVISKTLTRNIYKFKISYRQASPEMQPLLKKNEQLLLGGTEPKLLEHKNNIEERE